MEGEFSDSVCCDTECVECQVFVCNTCGDVCGDTSVAFSLVVWPLSVMVELEAFPDLWRRDHRNNCEAAQGDRTRDA